ncbi:MAG TPA: hypothetical protein VK911_02620, partial [Vicinamibacterales bacterium]|nr:hypothetical protein [Vicinamibacterales bacterium]
LLTDVEVRTPGFQAYDLEPARLPDLFAERPLVLAGKYRGDATGEIVITGFTGEGRFERRLAVNRSRVVPAGEALKYLWARERLASLSDLAGPGGTDLEAQQEITRLGLEYGLLTEFTSFVAVDQVVRRQDGKVTTVKQPLPLPQGVSELAVGGVARKMYVSAESMSVIGASPMDAARVGTLQGITGSLPSPAAPPRPSFAGIGVELVENRATGRAHSAAAVKEAVRRSLATAGCAVAAPCSLRLRITFGTNGRVERVQVEGGQQAAPPAALSCVRDALRRSLRLAGLTGGWMVVEVGWR